MKLKFKTLGLTLLSLTLFLASCNNNTDPGTSPSPSPSVEPSTPTYTINFELDGGNSPSYVQSKVVSELNKDDFFFDVTKEDYNFRGWNYNDVHVFDEFGNKLNTPTLVDPMTFVARYVDTAKMNIDINDVERGSVSGEGEYAYNSSISLLATPNEGYSFEGWYLDNELLSTSSEYTYTIGNKDVTLEARFGINSYTLHAISSHPSYGLVKIEDDTESYESCTKVIEYKKETYVAAISNPDHECPFVGWFDSLGNLLSAEATYIFNMTSSDYSVFAKWDVPDFEVSVNKNYVNAGNITGEGAYEYNSSVTLGVSTNEGYIFDGWYYEDSEVSSENTYTFIMPNHNYTVDAKWDLIQYDITYDFDGGVLPSGVSNPDTYNVESNITLKNPTKVGYLFTGWTLDGEVITTISRMTGELNLVATWEIVSYKVEIEFDSNRGSVSGAGTYEYNSSVTLSATANEGYIFYYWMHNDVIVTYESTVTFTMPSNDVTYKAVFDIQRYGIIYELDGGTNNPDNPISYSAEDEIILKDPTKVGYTFGGWTINGISITKIEKGTKGHLTIVANWVINTYKVTLSVNNEEYGSVSAGGTYVFGTSVTAVATDNSGYALKGWYEGDKCVSTENSYTFNVPGYDLELKAVFWTKTEDEDRWKKDQGINPVVDLDNNVVTYGLYPQTNVNDDQELVNQLSQLEPDSATGYYIVQGTYSYEKEYYAKITATPHSEHIAYFDNGIQIISGNEYWFKCEAIEWKILSTTENQHLLLTDKLLDTHRFNSEYEGTGEVGVYANNYAHSEIRTWLNNDFYNQVFHFNFSRLIDMTVDNSSSSTYLGDVNNNMYASENTTDKVCLLSVKDYHNKNYGFDEEIDQESDSRKAFTTDYDRARGCSVEVNEYKGNYWTRSPYSDYDDTDTTDSISANFILYSGNLYDESVDTKYSQSIRPAITIVA